MSICILPDDLPSPSRYHDGVREIYASAHQTGCLSLYPFVCYSAGGRKLFGLYIQAGFDRPRGQCSTETPKHGSDVKCAPENAVQ